MEEPYLPTIPGFKNYKIDTDGNVWSTIRGKYLKNNVSNTGRKQYAVLRLRSENGQFKSVYLHHLMAKTFLNHEADGHSFEIDHIDNNSLNNKLSNLQILTHSDHRLKTKYLNSQATFKSKIIFN